MKFRNVSFASQAARCDAWLYEPTGAGPHPCVVMGHGFGGIRVAGLDRFADRFTAAGLAVLVFDYRYFGTSQGEPRGLIDIKDQLADWRAAIAFARGLSGIDSERVALWGTSFSGGHVLTLAAADPRIAAAVIQNPFVDGPPTVMAMMRTVSAHTALRLVGAYLHDELRRLIRRAPRRLNLVGPPGSVAIFTTPDAEPGYRALLPAGAVGWAESVPARIFRPVVLYRPIRRARHIRCPLLAVVCDSDLITPAKPAVRVAQQAPRGEVKRYPIGHFDLFFGDWFDNVVRDEIEFLTRNLLHTKPVPRPESEEQADGRLH